MTVNFGAFQLYKFTHLNLSMTPEGTPIDTVAVTELYLETFFSTPYSPIKPKVPTLQRGKLINQI